MEHSAALRTGTVLRSPQGEYVVLGVLGQGGFGITYLVETTTLVGNVYAKARLALKEHYVNSICVRDPHTQNVYIKKSEADTWRKSYHSFLKEARRMKDQGLNHPNIIRINEVFVANNTAYYVMEYINGITLQQFVYNHGRLTVKDVKELISPVARAVALLHKNHLTHYDIKPQNIMITTNSEGRLYPVLIDFGLSKHYDDRGVVTTINHLVGVSRGFSPIEQYHPIPSFTPQADVYALGATLYFCLTGNVPEDAGCFDIRKSLDESGLVLPENMRAGLIHAMQPHKEDRQPNAQAFADEIFGQTTKTWENPGTEKNPLPVPPKAPVRRKTGWSSIEILYWTLLFLAVFGVTCWIIMANRNNSRRQHYANHQSSHSSSGQRGTNSNAAPHATPIAAKGPSNANFTSPDLSLFNLHGPVKSVVTTRNSGHLPYFFDASRIEFDRNGNLKNIYALAANKLTPGSSGVKIVRNSAGYITSLLYSPEGGEGNFSATFKWNGGNLKSYYIEDTRAWEGATYTYSGGNITYMDHTINDESLAIFTKTSYSNFKKDSYGNWTTCSFFSNIKEEEESFDDSPNRIHTSTPAGTIQRQILYY